MTPQGRLDDLLERWQEAGLITAGQAGSIRAYEERRDAPQAVRAEPYPPLRSQPPSVHAAPIPSPPRPPGSGAPPSTSPWTPPGGAVRLPGLGFDLRTLGAVLAGLALLSLFGSIFAVWTDLFVGPGSRAAAELEDILHLAASALGLAGGLRLAASRPSGKGLVYWSLGINLVATAVLGHDRLAHPLTVLSMVTWAVLLVLTWRARR